MRVAARSRRQPMTVTQAAKAQQFRALHEAPDAFVVANVWDGGSARMMAALGFAALATSSGASAGLLGRRDGRVTRDEALAQARVICDATDLPVSADLEKGFGDAPEIVAETIRLAADAGLVGCSIEDASGNPDAPIFELGQATERIAAAAAAARSLPFPFTLTGRLHIRNPGAQFRLARHRARAAKRANPQPRASRSLRWVAWFVARYRN